jgi:hypothetical protein
MVPVRQAPRQRGLPNGARDRSCRASTRVAGCPRNTCRRVWPTRSTTRRPRRCERSRRCAGRATRC